MIFKQKINKNICGKKYDIFYDAIFKKEYFLKPLGNKRKRAIENDVSLFIVSNYPCFLFRLPT